MHVMINSFCNGYHGYALACKAKIYHKNQLYQCIQPIEKTCGKKGQPSVKLAVNVYKSEDKNMTPMKEWLFKAGR